MPSPDPTTLPRDGNSVPLQNTYKSVTSGVTTAVTAGTPIQLTTTPTPCKRVDVVSNVNNTGTVYIGGPNTLASTQTGAPLQSPGSSGTLFVNDVSSVWFDSTASGDKISYIYHE